MLGQVSLVTRRPRGGVSLKPSTVTADSLRFGRGTGNEVLLQDVRVGLAEAELQPRDGVLHLTKVGTGALRLNGDPVGSAIVKPGDEIQIGPYKITVVEAPAGTDVAVTVELTDPLGDDFARLQSQSVIGLDRTRLSKRTAAWIGAVVVLVLFLVLPVAAYLVNPAPDPRAGPPARVVPAALDQAWNVGEISNPHKNFARECRSCHEDAFISVRDEACLTCHKGISHHVDVKKFPNLVINNTPCGGCHQEHRGARGVITRAQSLCTDCHDDLKRTAANAELRNVKDFGSAHPEFSVTLVADAGAKSFQRVELGGTTKPVDHPNLKFSHKSHVEPLAWPREMRKLGCVDCHVTEPGGGLMQPISFPKHCAECHNATLKFDAAALDRQVPHGDAVLAQRSIKDFYARVALEGGVTDLSAPEVVRRRPGTTLTEPERLEALAWAGQRALAARNFVFDDFRGCGTCHEVERSAADPKADFKIAPVLLQGHFMPKARFSHVKHATVDCEGCHAARQSVASSDVLIPGIENCRTCHGGEAAWAKVRSTCISCHDFHKPGTGPLGPLGKAGQTASTDK